MKVVHAYPWDIAGDPAAADRFAGLGADAVAVAAAYHTTRAATPFHPRHRVVDAQHAACYVPVRPDAWSGRRLTPAFPRWMPTEDPFGQARDSLRAAGQGVHAWVVLTHNSRLGTANPDLVVRNAFGDRYSYALCPAAADVADYCELLVTEVVSLGEPDGLILEACGPLGFRHGGHHEKTEGAGWSQVQAGLLSLCFCTACARRYTDAGLDAEHLATVIRGEVDAETPPASMEAALGEYASAVRKIRTGLASDLRHRLIKVARRLRAGIRISLHAAADPWATGPFATVSDHPPVADSLVGTCWTPPETAEAGLAALRALTSGGVGAYVLALPPADPDGLPELMARYAVAGADEFHVYHGGLASMERLAAISMSLVGAHNRIRRRNQ